MKEVDLKKIRHKLEKELDGKRFEHTLGVAYTAASLAMCHQEDAERALVAGLLHDCAKCMSNEKKLEICEKHHIPVTEVERQNPFLLHAKVGSYLAGKKYHIHDEDILNAIKNHTTGRPGMSRLEEIIYISDYIEPGRKQAPGLSAIRRLAFQDLDRALLQILKDTLDYLHGMDFPFDPMTQATYDYYVTDQTDDAKAGGKKCQNHPKKTNR